MTYGFAFVAKLFFPCNGIRLMAGSKEDAETVSAFFEDMKRRGLNDPLLVTLDGRGK